MKNKNIIYTEKDIHVGFQFKICYDTYEITSINPFIFKGLHNSAEHTTWYLDAIIRKFNDSSNSWKPLTLPQSQNIELWI
jgi:hypothetical protein